LNGARVGHSGQLNAVDGLAGREAWRSFLPELLGSNGDRWSSCEGEVDVEWSYCGSPKVVKLPDAIECV